MSNSQGSYRTTRQNKMAAFDKLPPSARKALANATFSYAPQPIRTRWTRQLVGYRNGVEIAKTIARWDRDEIAKIEAKRGRS